MLEFDEWHYRIKTAFQALVKAIGTLDAASVICGVSTTTIHRYGDISPDNDHLPPLRVVMLLEAACGRPIVTSAMASRTGHDLVPTVEREAANCINKLVAEMSRTGGNLNAEFIEASADGSLSVNEIKRLNDLAGKKAAQLNDFQRATATLLHSLASGQTIEGKAA
jgi:hypothetical protein